MELWNVHSVEQRLKAVNTVKKTNKKVQKQGNGNPDDARAILLDKENPVRNRSCTYGLYRIVIKAVMRDMSSGTPMDQALTRLNDLNADEIITAAKRMVERFHRHNPALPPEFFDSPEQKWLKEVSESTQPVPVPVPV
jgi:hypothetical protein